MAFYAILMAIILASCADLSTGPENPILANPVMSESTKAPVIGSDFPNQSFTMSASRNGATYFQGISFSKSGTTWAPSSTKYWPHTGTTAFLAYTCQGLSAVATWNSNAASGFSLGSSSSASTIPDNRSVQADIMYAGTGNVTKSSGTVDLVFKHAQALLKFTGRAYTAYNSGTNTGVTIESITFSSLKYQGKLSVTLTGNTTSASWTLQNTTGSATAASGSWGLPETGTVNVGPGYLVLPQGVVSFTINYTMHKGGSNTAKSYTFTPAGNWEMGTSYQYDIFIDQDAVEITATESVNTWNVQKDKNIPEVPEVATFGEIMISPAPLYYDGTSFVIKDNDWNHESYNSVAGMNAGSYYFQYSEISGVNNLTYDGYSDWRVPTNSDLYTIMDLSREGSIVNGTPNCHWVYIGLSDVTHTIYSASGLLIFPDGRVINGTALQNIDTNAYSSTTITNNELNTYLSQGCAFFPASGYYYSSGWSSGSGNYLSTTGNYISVCMGWNKYETYVFPYYASVRPVRSVSGNEKKTLTFAGLMIAPAPLYYDGLTFTIIDNDWNHNSYGSAMHTNAGSYMFSFDDVGKYFDSSMSSFNGYVIDNKNRISYGGYDDWRLPTLQEMQAIVGNNRPGSTTDKNGTKTYALLTINGVSPTYSGVSTVYGVLVFPDGGTFTGRSLSASNFSYNDLNEYLNQGAVFFPAGGRTSGTYYYDGGSRVVLITANNNYYQSTSGSGTLMFDRTFCGTVFLVRDY